MSKDSEARLLLRIVSTGESVLSKTKAALGDLRTWAATAFAALTSSAAVLAFKEAEKATNTLNQSLVNQGIYTKALSDDYQKMAAQLQRTTLYEDDAIKTAQATLQSYLGQTKLSKELVQATLDLAAAKKMDLASAADAVGKSIGTGTNALARQGLKMDDNASKSEKMAKVLGFLEGKHKGVAEAQAQGLGQLGVAKNALGELLEAVGERLAPFIELAARKVTELATSISENQTVWDIFQVTCQVVAKILAGMAFQVQVFGKVAISTFETVWNVANSVFRKGWTLEAWGIVKMEFQQTMGEIGTDYDAFQKRLKDIDGIYEEEEKKKNERSLKNTKDAAERRKQILRSAAIDEKEFFKTKSDEEIVDDAVHADKKTQQLISIYNYQLDHEKDATKKAAIEKGKREAIDEARFTTAQRLGIKIKTEKEKQDEERIQDFEKVSGNLSALQSSRSKTLVAIGKAGALANLAINTAQGAMGAYSAFAKPEYGAPGMAAGIGAAGALTLFGLEKAAEVSGIQLAEGGIVKARPGGVHAIIGEGGKDEAVIPLENGAPAIGSHITIVAKGGFLGDRQEAREFAKKVDEELFRLRKSNESMAFDRGVI